MNGYYYSIKHILLSNYLDQKSKKKGNARSKQINIFFALFNYLVPFLGKKQFYPPLLQIILFPLIKSTDIFSIKSAFFEFNRKDNQ
jgi:hypothetical protein